MPRLAKKINLKQAVTHNPKLQFALARIDKSTKSLVLYEWCSCREVLHNYWTSSPHTKRNLMCFGCYYPVKILEFLRITEERIAKLSGEKIVYSKVGRTDQKGINYIEISNFWIANPIRKSFFTELLRAASCYDRPLTNEEKNKIQSTPKPERADYWTALWMRSYFLQTQPAVLRFLDGHTHYSRRMNHQWLSAMNLNAGYQAPAGECIQPVRGKLLERLLVMPPKPKAKAKAKPKPKAKETTAKKTQARSRAKVA